MALLELQKYFEAFRRSASADAGEHELDEGVIASLIGPNGAGKTTLFNTLTGLYRPDEGEILFQNRSLIGLKPEKITGAGISRTFQNIRLFSHMSVLENILVGCHARLQTNLADILIRSKRFHTRGERTHAAKRRS